MVWYGNSGNLTLVGMTFRDVDAEHGTWSLDKVEYTNRFTGLQGYKR